MFLRDRDDDDRTNAQHDHDGNTVELGHLHEPPGSAISTAADHHDPVDEPVYEPVDLDDDPIDDEFAPSARQRLGRSTAVLSVVLIVALGFLIGAYVQKHYGRAHTATAARAGAANVRTGNFTGAGGRYGNGYGAGSAGGNGGTGAGTGAASTAPTSTAATPAVIGKITSLTSTEAKVTNLGGKVVAVKLSPTTKLTTTLKASHLKVGQTVAVTGKTGASSVTATAITIQ